MFCTRCGQNVQEGTSFCPFCGQKNGTAVTPAPNTLDPALTPPLHQPIFVSFAYAGFWLRLAAYFIDGLILGIPFGAIIMGLIFMLGGFRVLLRRHVPYEYGGVPSAAIAAPIIATFFFALIVFMGVQWLYFAGLESSERQATVGKGLMSLRVTDMHGERLTFGRATGRFFAKIISGMIPMAIGYLMAGFTEKKQALHDMIASTLVLRK